MINLFSLLLIFVFLNDISAIVLINFLKNHRIKITNDTRESTDSQFFASNSTVWQRLMKHLPQ